MIFCLQQSAVSQVFFCCVHVSQLYFSDYNTSLIALHEIHWIVSVSITFIIAFLEVTFPVFPRYLEKHQSSDKMENKRGIATGYTSWDSRNSFNQQYVLLSPLSPLHNTSNVLGKTRTFVQYTNKMMHRSLSYQYLNQFLESTGHCCPQNLSRSFKPRSGWNKFIAKRFGGAHHP